MITDRISLNIALKYLNQFEQNEGKVIDILFSIKNAITGVSKSPPSFSNLDVLVAYINKYAQLTTFKDLDCTPLLLFELKDFTMVKNGTNKNFIYFDNNKFITKSENINQFSIESFNRDYFTDMLEVKSIFENIKLNEYILNQLEYIECGYIEIYDQGSIENLQQLYNKYK